MASRIFINKPGVGTVIVRKTIPGQRSHRYEVLKSFVYKLGLYPGDYCKKCNTMLLNPQSLLLHVGTACRKRKTTNG